MKNIHTIITACFTLSLLFVSCIEDEQLVQLGQGTLSLSGLELQAVATEQVATRALSEDFTVQVYKEGAITPDTTFTYQSTQQSGSKVTLNVGNYYLKAYNAAHADGDYTCRLLLPKRSIHHQGRLDNLRECLCTNGKLRRTLGVACHV